MTTHTDALRNPSALQAASLSAQGALRGELVDRLIKDGVGTKAAFAIAQQLHVRVARVDETETPCGRPHHGFALILMADRTAFKAGTPARGVLEELSEQLINTHKATCHEAVLPMDTLFRCSTSIAAHPDLPDCKTLNQKQNCMLFGPTASLPLDKDGNLVHGNLKSALFAKSLPDLLSGINNNLSPHRHINLALHQGRGA